MNIRFFFFFYLLEVVVEWAVTNSPQGFPGGSDDKASARNEGDLGSIPKLGRSPGEGNGNPFQYSCLENSMDGGAWWDIYSPWGRKELDTTDGEN